MSKIVNKVRVMAEFPGYEIGDVLLLNPATGVFNFMKTTTEDGLVSDNLLKGFDTVAFNLTDSVKQSFTKRDVILYLDEYFEDISIYKIRPPRELEERVHELKAHMARIKEDDTFDELDREEAITVWQNMLWEYEWILGRKDMYNAPEVTSPMDEVENTFQDLPVDMLLGEFIDGNQLEFDKEQAKEVAKYKLDENDTDAATEGREDS
jgi:hypothetical protein